MIFARYNGVDTDDLTSGRVYLAKPEVNGAETVGFEFLEVINDNGDNLRINPEDGLFEYFDEVYAVVTEPVIGPIDGLKSGDVVVLKGVSADGSLFDVKEVGYRDASIFIVLDRTNVFPGLNVFDCRSNRWTRVRRVDGCLWITVGDESDVRPPSQFAFAVADGDILTEPVVRCISDDGVNLTKEKLYILKGNDANGLVIVEDDSGDESSFMSSRFYMNF